MRIIDGRTIETECDSCACTFTADRDEDGYPVQINCPACQETLTELCAELAREHDRVWFETFLFFPFKQLPAPSRVLADLDWAEEQVRAWEDWREHQDLLDAADQEAYYSALWREENEQSS